VYNFSVNSKIHEVKTFREFMEAFQVNEKDLLFINKFTYRAFLENMDLPAK
jgi:hypothetical protein